jgi:hypothetical protein
MKKAIFYTMDALLASMLLLGAVLLIYANYTPEDLNVEQQTFLSQDTLTVLSELKIYELNNSFVNAEIAAGNITDVNKSALDQIGEYWALDNGDNTSVNKAMILLQIIINTSLPSDYGVRTSMGDNVLLIHNISRKVNSVSSNRMIAGIEQGRPITGSSGTSYLKKIRNKKTSSYTYFGGFVGQGNITVYLNLPSDFNSSRMIDTQLKIETPGTFNVRINNIPCGSSYSGAVGQVFVWDLVSCNSSFVSGANSVRLDFTSALNISYISGGFIKATYSTDTLVENTTATGYYRYHFPDINGFINFYDVLSVQGNIVNWTINATFYNPYDTLITLGNETVLWSSGNVSGNQNIIIPRTNQALPQEPIPLRFTVTNFSNISTILYGIPADIFMMTDVSGSMDYSTGCIGNLYNCSYLYRQVNGGTYFPVSCIISNSAVCSSPSNPCSASPFYSAKTYVIGCNVSKLKVAKNASIEFIDNISANSTNYRFGLVDYSTNTNTLTPLTNNLVTLHSVINSYVASGSTCTCCALNRARNSIITSGNKKFMILLSDGEPNECCSNLNDYTGGGSCGAGANNPINWSIKSGHEACSNDINVYTIGFGTSMSEAGKYAMQQIACSPSNSSNITSNVSHYYAATNTTDLEEAFRNITQELMIAANFSSQTVTVVGNFTYSRLFGSSYIDVQYIPLSDDFEQNKISLVTESTQFNGCSALVPIPPNIEISDAFVTSYSSSHWTDSLAVNGVNVFNLSKYGSEYKILGDPFVIQVPSSLLHSGVLNNISLVVGDSPTNHSNCSSNNTLIYTALINVSTGRTDALEKTVGCNWSVQSISGNVFSVMVPKEYSGTNKCYYTNSSIVYDSTDVYDVAVYSMLKQLDYQNNGMIFFDLTQNDLEIILITTGQVAYMWGPSLMKIEVWQ